MVAAGCRALYPVDALSVMGLSEVLAHLPRLLAVRRALMKRFREDPPDVFVGLDAPDFNLRLEEELKKRGVPTVHVVSPSVWAWRRYRVRRIRRSTDLMLTLFPFEEEFYREHKLPVACIGHPLADRIPLEPDRLAARQRLGLQEDDRVVAVFPGSRMNEVAQLSRPFVTTIERCHRKYPDVIFVLPFANSQVRECFLRVAGTGISRYHTVLLDGKSHDALEACDAVLLASGTATLEAMLYKRPMVVAYRLSAFSWQVMRRLVKLPFYSLPNLLAGSRLVPEFIQDEINAEQMASTLIDALDQGLDRVSAATFAVVHENLKRGADQVAARHILALAGA